MMTISSLVKSIIGYPYFSNPLFLIVLAMFLYASQNVLIDRYFKNVTPVVNIFAYSIGLFFMSLCVLKIRPFAMEITLPVGMQFVAIAVACVLVFFGDFLTFRSYNIGGSLPLITTAVATFPVFASLIKWTLGGPRPTMQHILAWILVAAALYLIGRAESQATHP
jgi:drug/metabolite transporter (DMT)-like permease